MAINVTKDNYSEEVENSSIPVVVDAYATWCGPCKQFTPIFEDVSLELSHKYKFVKLNIDEARDLAIKLNISSIPTLLFVKNGVISARETGSMTKAAFKEKIEKHLG